MSELRWILAGACGFFFLACLATSIGVAVRWLRTGQTGSGLWFAGGIVAFAGIMLAPLGTPGQRLHYAWIPLGLELALFAAFLGLDVARGRHRPPGA